MDYSCCGCRRNGRGFLFNMQPLPEFANHGIGACGTLWQGRETMERNEVPPRGLSAFRKKAGKIRGIAAVSPEVRNWRSVLSMCSDQKIRCCFENAETVRVAETGKAVPVRLPLFLCFFSPRYIFSVFPPFTQAYVLIPRSLFFRSRGSLFLSEYPVPPSGLTASENSINTYP